MNHQRIIAAIASTLILFGAGAGVSAMAAEPTPTSAAEEARGWDQVRAKRVQADSKAPKQQPAARTLTGGGTATSSAITTVNGSWPTRSGVILVNKGLSTSVPYVQSGHAAIIYSPYRIVESVLEGVKMSSHSWNKEGGGANAEVWATTVISTTPAQDTAAAVWAAKQLGKPYNKNSYATHLRNTFYCSQLVWAAFKDLYGINLNTSLFDLPYGGAILVAPLELVSSSKVRLVFYGRA